MDEGIDFILDLFAGSVLLVVASFVVILLLFSAFMYGWADKHKVEGVTFGKCLWAAILWGVISTILGVGLSVIFPPIGVIVELFMFLLGGPLIVQANIKSDLGTAFLVWIMGWLWIVLMGVNIAMVGFSIAFGGEAVAGIILLGGIIAAGILFFKWLEGPSPAQRKRLEAKRAASIPKVSKKEPPTPKVKREPSHMRVLKERLARGEISVEEYGQLSGILMGEEEPAEAQHDEIIEDKKETRMETEEETVKRLYAEGQITEEEFKQHMTRLSNR